MSDDFDSFDDDDEDFDLDDETDGLEEPSMGDSDDAEPASAQSARAAAPAKPFDPDAKVPFFKNWIWWVSLIAAIPGGFLLASVIGMATKSTQKTGLTMGILMFVTGFIALMTIALPILLALGKFLGGDIVKTPAVAAVPAGAPVSHSDTFEDDDDGGFGDDDFEDDDDDFDDFDDDEFE